MEFAVFGFRKLPILKVLTLSVPKQTLPVHEIIFRTAEFNFPVVGWIE